MIAIKNTMNQEEWRKWTKNVGIFATPLLILFLTAIAQGVPLQQALYLLYGAVLNALIDLLRKYKAGVDTIQIVRQTGALETQTVPVNTPAVKEPLG